MLAAGLLPPGVEVPGADHLGADPGVVELEDRLVVHPQVPPAGALLQLGDLGQHRLVVRPEPVVGLPLPLHQRVPDEQLAADHRVDRAVLHPPAHDQRDPVAA